MNNILLLITITACLATTSSAFTSPLHQQAHCLSASPRTRDTSHRNAQPFFCDDETSTTAAADDDDDLDCGPGFQKILAADGPCCAFDFDAVSSKLPPSIFDNNPTLKIKYEEKNRARKNFNLKPLSPEEFVVLQAQVHAMEREEGEKQGVARQVAVEEREERERIKKSQEGGGGMFQSFFKDTCQSNFDCDRPEVCCDFGFKKVCCSSGNTNRDIEYELALIPVPQSG